MKMKRFVFCIIFHSGFLNINKRKIIIFLYTLSHLNYFHKHGSKVLLIYVFRFRRNFFHLFGRAFRNKYLQVKGVLPSSTPKEGISSISLELYPQKVLAAGLVVEYQEMCFSRNCLIWKKSLNRYNQKCLSFDSSFVYKLWSTRYT